MTVFPGSGGLRLHPGVHTGGHVPGGRLPTHFRSRRRAPRVPARRLPGNNIVLLYVGIEPEYPAHWNANHIFKIKILTKKQTCNTTRILHKNLPRNCRRELALLDHITDDKKVQN